MIERAHDTENEQHGQKAVQKVDLRIVQLLPIVVLTNFDDRLLVGQVLHFIQLHEVGVISFRKIAVFGDCQPVEGIEQQEDIVGEYADDSKEIIDDIISYKIGIRPWNIALVNCIVILEINLRLPHQNSSHDIDDAEGVEFVGLMDVVVTVGEGIGAEFAHLDQEEEQQEGIEDDDGEGEVVVDRVGVAEGLLVAGEFLAHQLQQLQDGVDQLRQISSWIFITINFKYESGQEFSLAAEEAKAQAIHEQQATDNCSQQSGSAGGGLSRDQRVQGREGE